MNLSYMTTEMWTAFEEEYPEAHTELEYRCQEAELELHLGFATDVDGSYYGPMQERIRHLMWARWRHDMTGFHQTTHGYRIDVRSTCGGYRARYMMGQYCAGSSFINNVTDETDAKFQITDAFVEVLQGKAVTK